MRREPRGGAEEPGDLHPSLEMGNAEVRATEMGQLAQEHEVERGVREERGQAGPEHGARGETPQAPGAETALFTINRMGRRASSRHDDQRRTPWTRARSASTGPWDEEVERSQQSWMSMSRSSDEPAVVVRWIRARAARLSRAPRAPAAEAAAGASTVSGFLAVVAERSAGPPLVVPVGLPQGPSAAGAARSAGASPSGGGAGEATVSSGRSQGVVEVCGPESWGPESWGPERWGHEGR